MLQSRAVQQVVPPPPPFLLISHIFLELIALSPPSLLPFLSADSRCWTERSLMWIFYSRLCCCPWGSCLDSITVCVTCLGSRMVVVTCQGSCTVVVTVKTTSILGGGQRRMCQLGYFSLLNVCWSPSSVTRCGFHLALTLSMLTQRTSSWSTRQSKTLNPLSSRAVGTRTDLLNCQ